MLLRIRQDILCGALFVALGGTFALSARHLSFGTANRMGPGYFPSLLSLALVAIGLVLILRGWRSGEGKEVAVPWRGLAIILASPVVFGLVLLPLGFVPAVAATALLSAFASRQSRPASALATAVVLMALCWVVFILGLRLSIPVLGTWF
ncbi:tripartite tricarboxylate transporter TctB family protein [Bosea sp. TAB14]|uniref:tripartite tricarboxylate transporter TctB family protein n=1 Tax=Bosea sp. TAB14 TaxID=3237481 RepID=UPI003F901518